MIVPWQPVHRGRQTAGKIAVFGRKSTTMDEAKIWPENRRPDLGHWYFGTSEFGTETWDRRDLALTFR
jgi:hypothetical protein